MPRALPILKATCGRHLLRCGCAAFIAGAIHTASAADRTPPGGAEAVKCAAIGGPLVKLGQPGDLLSAVVAPAHGGELVSLVMRTASGSSELLYRALDFCNRPGWEGKAPVLWPATGRNFLIDPETLSPGAPITAAFGWSWRGQRLGMPIHGFARTQVWHLDMLSRVDDQTIVRVSLDDNPQTRAIYPFGFHHTITYVLAGTELTVRHDITAARNNPGPMPFSIGNHLTFATATLRGSSEHPILLSSRATLRQDTDRFGRPIGPMHDQLPLRETPLVDIGRNIATSLGGYHRGGVMAKVSSPAGILITIAQGRMPGARPDAIRFNLWGDTDAGYFAIEPWYGRQNSLADGSGIVRLKPGKHFQWSFSVSARANKLQN